MKLSNLRVSYDTFLNAIAVDQLRLLVWSKTKDGEKGRNQPKSIAETLLIQSSQEKQNKGFWSGEEFEKERLKIIQGGG